MILPEIRNDHTRNPQWSCLKSAMILPKIRSDHTRNPQWSCPKTAVVLPKIRSNLAWNPQWFCPKSAMILPKRFKNASSPKMHKIQRINLREILKCVKSAYVKPKKMATKCSKVYWSKFRLLWWKIRLKIKCGGKNFPAREKIKIVKRRKNIDERIFHVRYFVMTRVHLHKLQGMNYSDICSTKPV